MSIGVRGFIRSDGGDEGPFFLSGVGVGDLGGGVDLHVCEVVVLVDELGRGCGVVDFDGVYCAV